MEQIVIIIHVIIALAMISLILLQQGKGAEMGASFGSGASQTMFGSQGGMSFFTKLTGILAVAFFSTSFALAVIAKNRSSIEVNHIAPATVDEPVIEEIIDSSIPDNDVPYVEQATGSSESDVPAITNKGVPAATD